MKKGLLAGFLVASVFVCIGCQQDGTIRDFAPSGGGPLLRHVVLFGFKEGTSPQDIRRIEEAFATLPSRIPQIHDFEWGTDVSVENLAQGYTHCFLMTFKTEADRAAYLPHPAHQDFVKVLEPHLDKVLVVDYWTHH